MIYITKRTKPDGFFLLRRLLLTQHAYTAKAVFTFWNPFSLICPR